MRHSPETADLLFFFFFFFFFAGSASSRSAACPLRISASMPGGTGTGLGLTDTGCSCSLPFASMIHANASEETEGPVHCGRSGEKLPNQLSEYMTRNAITSILLWRRISSLMLIWSRCRQPPEKLSNSYS